MLFEWVQDDFLATTKQRWWLFQPWLIKRILQVLNKLKQFRDQTPTSKLDKALDILCVFLLLTIVDLCTVKCGITACFLLSILGVKPIEEGFSSNVSSVAARGHLHISALDPGLKCPLIMWQHIWFTRLVCANGPNSARPLWTCRTVLSWTGIRHKTTGTTVLPHS